MARRTRGAAAGLTNVVGGMLVALDEQLLRSTPRAEILVKRGKAIRGLSAAGGTLLVGLPGDPIDLDSEADGTDAPTDVDAPDTTASPVTPRLEDPRPTGG